MSGYGPAEIIVQSRSARMLAIYGAACANMVIDRIRDGYGPPASDNEWDAIVEEALSIAESCDDALMRTRGR